MHQLYGPVNANDHWKIYGHLPEQLIGINGARSITNDYMIDIPVFMTV